MKKKFLSIIIIVVIICQSQNYYDVLNITEENSKIIIKGLIDEEAIISSDTHLNNLARKSDSLIKRSNSITYLYIDENSVEGTMNFYRIRYHLTPRKAVFWNLYAFDNIYNDIKYINLIKKYHVSYIIIYKNSDFLKLVGKKYNGNDYIFKVDKKKLNSSMKLIEVIKNIEGVSSK